MDDSKSQSHGHIVMLPFMAHGHLIPFLALARRIRRQTPFAVTLAATPLNLWYLRSTMSPDDDDSGIRFHELPFRSSDHGLPPDTENTENLPLSQIGMLFRSSVSLATPVERLISDITAEEGRPPLCVISDVLFGWSVDIARRLGTKSITFTTGGAYGTLAYVSIWVHLPHRSTDTEEFSVPGFPERCRFHRSQLHRFIREVEPTDEWSKFFQVQIKLTLASDGWLCNSVEEIEPLGFDLSRKYLKLPVWAIGPLIPSRMLRKSSPISPNSRSKSLQKHTGKAFGVSPEKCLDFLSSHSPNSVLYISFGSQNTISPSQMMQLAIGLESSGKPFLWVIRPPLGFDTKGEFRPEWLPLGFEDRVTGSNQGLLVRNWAPQLDILSHGSTGAFLSHCGWNSIMESLSQGVPILGWPMAAEQAHNAKMMVEEMGVCIELACGVESRIEAEEVKRVIEMVMEGEGEGGEMRKRANAVMGQMREAVKEGSDDDKGSSLKALDDFVRTILGDSTNRTFSFL
ncbi:LOW QUALITY PROTEIN: crocetin glucosyltransferase 3 [Eucalyptus grandis]|uniref:LOW QUALITY PROTEIN: crocetin glucosyltransferase 3 n=1 Tax=Eucalyptus grandis TaxID=71139 RepID=UPI00192EFD25|nr:LOW QUALITY PROTEIN: crocetin glucosyltransferase 3 [Eucalyptus grandis]